MGTRGLERDCGGLDPRNRCALPADQRHGIRFGYIPSGARTAPAAVGNAPANGSRNVAWRQAKRRPPTIESNSSANTFTLTLDWREVPDVSDEFWSKRLGAKISKDEAMVLLLAAEPLGTTAEEVAASQGIRVEDAQQLIQRLTVQTLVSQRSGRVLIAARLHALADEAKRAGSGH